MDQVLWNFMMKKANNNITYITDNWRTAGIWLAGQTKEPFLFETTNFTWETRENSWPKNGELKLFHPMTGNPLYPHRLNELTLPQPWTYSKNYEECALCWNSYKERKIPDYWNDRLLPFCHYDSCARSRGESFICVFKTEPTFIVRGLCATSVVDSEYKFADPAPMDLSIEHPWPKLWGPPSHFVGPKGWIISRNETDKKWMITHYHYPELSLKMLDTDVLPIGKHKWMVENNACNEGKTSAEILQLSGCEEEQFTCDDGKCLEMSQRCNNIEDCDDVSDEKNCRTVYIDPEKYLKSKPPPSNEDDAKLPVILR